MGGRGGRGVAKMTPRPSVWPVHPAGPWSCAPRSGTPRPPRPPLLCARHLVARRRGVVCYSRRVGCLHVAARRLKPRARRAATATRRIGGFVVGCCLLSSGGRAFCPFETRAVLSRHARLTRVVQRHALHSFQFSGHSICLLGAARGAPWHRSRSRPAGAARGPTRGLPTPRPMSIPSSAPPPPPPPPPAFTAAGSESRPATRPACAGPPVTRAAGRTAGATCTWTWRSRCRGS